MKRRERKVEEGKKNRRKEKKKSKQSVGAQAPEGASGRNVPTLFFFFFLQKQRRVFCPQKGVFPPPPFRQNGHFFVHFLHCRQMSTMPCLQHVLLGACKAVLSMKLGCHAEFWKVRCDICNICCWVLVAWFCL